MPLENVTPPSSPASSASALNQREFLKLLVTQLQNQDPLKPLDNQQFLAQMAQFSSLAQSQELNEKLGSLLQIQGASQSIGLLNKQIDFMQNSTTFTGRITSISFSGDQPSLTVSTTSGDMTVTMGQIVRVQ